MKARLPIRDEGPELRDLDFGPGAEKLARELVGEAERTVGSRRERVVNQMHVLAEFHYYFPGCQVIEEIPADEPVPAKGFGRRG